MPPLTSFGLKTLSRGVGYAVR